MQKTLSFFITTLYKDFSRFSNEKLKEIGLSKGLLHFILYIGKNPNCSPTNLSTALYFDSGHTTRSIDKLVEVGFVIREKDNKDKRAYQLKLTEKGEDAFNSSFLLFSQWDEKILEHFSMVDREQLLSLLGKLV